MFEVLAHAVAQAQIVMPLQQEAPHPLIRMPFPQRLDLHGLQVTQRPLDRRAITGQVQRLAVAPGIRAASLAYRQPNLPTPLQFQQQRPAGHVLEPPSPIAPTPALA
jgi:hypothetical protein